MRPHIPNDLVTREDMQAFMNAFSPDDCETVRIPILEGAAVAVVHTTDLLDIGGMTELTLGVLRD
jgi:hypothetical protein